MLACLFVCVETVVYWSWFFYYTLYTVVVYFLAWQRRRVQPFLARNFFLVSLSAACTYGVRTWFYVAASPGGTALKRAWLETQSQCRATSVVVTVLFAGMVIPYLLRALRLHLVFQVRKVEALVTSSAHTLTSHVMPSALFVFRC
jgi:hypothetical protein